jgi:hypothetical protein
MTLQCVYVQEKLGMMDVLCLCMCKKKEEDDDDDDDDDDEKASQSSWMMRLFLCVSMYKMGACYSSVTLFVGAF